MLAKAKVLKAYTGDLGSVYRLDLDRANREFLQACQGVRRIAPLAALNPRDMNWRQTLADVSPAFAGVILYPYLHNWRLDDPAYAECFKQLAKRRMPVWINIMLGDSRFRHAGLACRPVAASELTGFGQAAPPNRYVIQGAGVGHVAAFMKSAPARSRFRFEISRLTDVSGALAKTIQEYHEKSASRKLEQMRGAAQNYLAQGASGVYLFNFRCLPNPYVKVSSADLRKLGTILKQVGQLDTFQKLAKQYLFWNEFLQIETARPSRYRQTLRFFIRDPLLRAKRTYVTIQFREVTRKNPHYVGPFRAMKGRPASWVPNGRLHYFFNEKQTPENRIRREAQPEKRIPCGFVLDRHRLVTIHLTGSHLKYGGNQFSVFMPGFPHESEPYVYIYEFTVRAPVISDENR